MVLDYISKTNKESPQVEYPNEAGRLLLTYSATIDGLTIITKGQCSLME